LCSPYGELIRPHNPSFDLRFRLLQAAFQQGNRASRLFDCCRNSRQAEIERPLSNF
jgi:hypothetical protein